MTIKGKEIELEKNKDFFIGEIKRIEKVNKFIFTFNCILLVLILIIVFEMLNFFIF